MRAAPSRKPPAADEAGADATPTVEAQFTKLTQQFDLLKSQVRQAQQLASLGTASAMIAHEMSNLLTPIVSYAEYARDSDDPGLMKKALTVTARNARILVRMSERVLEISSASPPERGRFPVRQVVEDAITSMCRDFSRDGITLTVRVDDELFADCDPLQLQQVLFNLLLNAREAMAPTRSGRLTITACREAEATAGNPSASSGSAEGPDRGANGAVRITVHNTGPAIPPDLLPHIFDALQTTKQSRREGRRRCGGLGLALCRDLIEENGGTITVTSDDDSGTTFTITLPSAPAPSGSDSADPVTVGCGLAP